MSEVLSGLNVRLGSVRRSTVRTILRASESIMILSPANDNGALTCLLPLSRLVSTNSSRPRTVIIAPNERLTLRSTAILGGVNDKLHTVTYCKNHTAVSRRQIVGRIHPRVIFKAPNHLGSRLSGNGLGHCRVECLMVSRFSGYLRVNFRSRVDHLIGSLPNLHHRFLLSTARTRRVPHFMRVNEMRGVSCQVSRRRMPRHMRVCGIRDPIGSGLRDLNVLLHDLNSRDAVIFLGCHSDMRHAGGCLIRRKFSASFFRNNLRRGRHRTSLCHFDGNDTGVLMDASLTSHNLSVPSVSGVVRCRVPRDRSNCVRHMKHATE